MVWGPVAWIPRIFYEIDCYERGTPIGTICINLLVVDSRNETKHINYLSFKPTKKFHDPNSFKFVPNDQRIFWAYLMLLLSMLSDLCFMTSLPRQK